MIKKCVVCGAGFYAPPSSKKITCSKKCSSVRKSETHNGKNFSDETRQKLKEKALKRGYTENLKKGTPAAIKSIKAGRTHENSSAKSYVLLSPDGRKFEATNIQQWVRENIHFFEGNADDKNVQKIAHGFYTIKKNTKNNHKGKTYKGWQVIDWDDRKNVEKLRAQKKGED